MSAQPASRSPARPGAIVLLTDFGTSDWYVAEMKGVLLALAPGSPLVDFCHDVPPGDVARAAYLLARAHASFPAGKIGRAHV